MKVEKQEQIEGQTVKYNLIEEEEAKLYLDGEPVKIQTITNVITEEEVDKKLAYWQEIKDAMVTSQ